MELYEEIIAKYFGGEIVKIMKIDAKEIVELQCYKTLAKIKKIVEDDAINDRQCFEKIEEIILSLEVVGSDGGTRHDFG